MVTTTDNDGDVRPVWFVTGGTNWWMRTQFWQCGYDHEHDAVIREMQPDDRIAMKADEFRPYVTDERGNPTDSVGIWAVGRITRTSGHFVFVDDDWRNSLGQSNADGRPVGNYSVADIADRFPENQCIWRMEPNDDATQDFISEVFEVPAPAAVRREPSSSPSAALADSLFLPPDFLEEINTLLEEKKQVIFQGPPGTGKTFVAQKLAEHLAGSKDRVTLVQFHPSYDYVDFVQGYRPDSAHDGQLRYELKAGPLLQAARAASKDAEANLGTKHFLIIDEINRANLGKVLSELYYLLEYRNEAVKFQYSDDLYSLPDNLYIIGTMNTADRSIALVDLALRRRFYFVEFHPGKPPIKGLLHRYLEKNPATVDWVAHVVDRANELLSDEPHAAIGPSHFMKENLDEDRVRRIWKHAVLPYIDERLFGQDEARMAEFELDTLRKAVASGGANSDREDASPTTNVEDSNNDASD